MRSRVQGRALLWMKIRNKVGNWSVACISVTKILFRMESTNLAQRVKFQLIALLEFSKEAVGCSSAFFGALPSRMVLKVVDWNISFLLKGLQDGSKMLARPISCLAEH